MICPGCQAENRDGRRFCAACGAPLALTCRGCGFANEPGDRFCGGCGEALVAAAPAATTGERRQVTVFFADLAGYTKLSSSLDPEETHALLQKFFAAVDGAVDAFGGTIDKHIGDNVMAIFGAPVAHGDDPVRAVRAAVEAHKRVDALAAEVGIPLKVHIGLAVGEVIASSLGSAHHDEYTVIGDSVNLAARLQDRAVAGETLVSDAVRRAASRAATFTSLGALTFKGIPAPVQTWRLDGLNAQPVADVTPFTGREREIAVLTTAAREIRRAGAGQVFLVRGEPGIGKTRLLTETRRRVVADGFADHGVLLFDFGAGKGYAAVRGLAESLLGLGAASTPAERRAAVQAAVGADDDALFTFALAGADLTDDERRLFEAFDNATRDAALARACNALVVTAAAARPLLLVVEDAHWADAFTRRWLAELAPIAKAHPILLLVTSRLLGFTADELPGVEATVLTLQPLTADDALAIARAAGAGNARLEKLVARAEGNPLFLEQLIENARENDESIPTTVHGLMTARVDRLGAKDKQALQAAAVAGQRFTADFVRALTGFDAYTLDSLIEHHLVKVDGDAFLFQHALLQEAVYATLTKARRKELHAAAAKLYRGRDEVLWAQHLDRAEDPAAAEAYAHAAAVQTTAYLFEGALELADRGLALTTDPALLRRLLEQRGALLQALGRIDDAADAYREAVALAGTPEAAFKGHLHLAALYRQASRYEQALNALRDADAAAPAFADPAARAEFHYQRGSIRFALGDIDGSLEDHGAALTHARVAKAREWEARALSGIGDAYFAKGRLGTSGEHFRACIQICRELGLERYALVNQGMLCMVEAQLGDYRGTMERLTAPLATAERLRDHVTAALLHLQFAFTHPLADDVAAAAEAAQRAVEHARRAGARRFVSEALTALGGQLLRLGRRDEAEAAIREALATARETGMSFCGPMILGALALTTRDLGERARLLEEGEALCAAGTMLFNHYEFRDAAIECAVEQGLPGEASRHAEALARAAVEDVPVVRLIELRGRAIGGDEEARRAHADLVRKLDIRGRLSTVPHGL